MKVTMKRQLIMMMVLVVTVTMAQEREVAVVPDDDSVDPGLKEGDIAPSWALMSGPGKFEFLKTWTEEKGKKLRKPMTQPDRHVVVLSFFATWCKPCMKELPHLQNLYEKYEGEKIKFFMIDITEATRTVRGLEDSPKAGPFLEEKGITMPILNDSRGVAKKRYGAKTLPRLYVVDKYRTIRLAKKGFDEGEDFEGDLISVIDDLLKDMPGNQVLLDHYLDKAIEAEADAICDGKDVYIIGMMEHIEPCGIHSGDSYAVLPTFDLSDNVLQQMINITNKIAVALETIGLINIQFAIKDEIVYVIEANPRASRTVPFIAKAYDEPYVKYAAKVMMGENKVTDFDFNPTKKGYAIKVPVFSFDKFPNVNKELGPEMKSTGEAIYFIDDLQDDYFIKVYSERNLYLSK